MRIIEIKLHDIYPCLKSDEAKLTVYLPYNMKEMNRSDRKRPTILLCPGGGYFFTSEREAEIIGNKIIAMGYNVAILDYSVDKYTFPCQITEAAAAMDLLHKNSDEWNVDPGKIAIMGFSAGGHLSAHYSTCYDCEEVRELFPDSYRPDASILCYPVITADPERTHLGSFICLSGHEGLSEEELNRYSCEKHVTENTPPAFIWSTSEDDLVPVVNSLLYAKALTDNKVPYELHIYPFGRHGLSTADFDSNDELDEKDLHVREWLPALEKWLRLVFGL